MFLFFFIFLNINFKVAQKRDKFPEKWPFRLTRMLIKALEACGIEGNYRNTCELVIRVLRENKESMMAVLEAFVHDPLLNWRLIYKSTQISETTNMNTMKSVFIESFKSKKES